MATTTPNQTKLVSYLKAQSHINPTVAFDPKNCTLSDVSTVSRTSALVANCRGDDSFVTELAPYVGPGVLSRLSVDAQDDEASDKSDSSSNTSAIWIRDGEAMSKPTASVGYQVDDKHPKLRLEMDDIVSPLGGPNDFGAGVILLLKICGALTAKYDSRTVARVGTLVRNNTMTAMHETSNAEGAVRNMEQGSEAKVDRMLNALLGQVGERKRSVRMNSNEPVLLINNAGLSEFEFGDTVTETIEQLQCQWNIWPVRIYAGRFLGSSNSSFSISLLNVTNTDIGGPSMIQLLDAPCEARGWLGYARREVWNGRNLLEKDERRQEEPLPVKTHAEEVSANVEEQDTDEDVAQAPISYDEVEEGKDSEPSNDEEAEYAHCSESGQDVAEPDAPEAHEDSDEPQEDVRRYFKPDAAPIRHPSWDHPTGGESLLDLIKSQASGLHRTSHESDDESGTATQPKPAQQSGQGSDDEFVVL